jgi:hypothetical protein
LLLAVTSLLFALVSEARGRPPRIEDVEQSLIHDSSYRVRVDAALVLGQLRQPRSVPALVRALDDGHPAVRATAAQALGRIGDGAAREPLVRAARDGSAMVRRLAEQALRELPSPALVPAALPPPKRELEGRSPRPLRPAFDVKPMGDRSHHAGAALRAQMRALVTAELSPVGDIGGSADSTRGFVIDGVIKNLSFAMRRDLVEVTCAVQLVVSKQPSGGIFLLTSGEAVVQKPRRQFKSRHRSHMEAEALENAVHGASEDLRRHLARP